MPPRPELALEAVAIGEGSGELSGVIGHGRSGRGRQYVSPMGEEG